MSKAIRTAALFAVVAVLAAACSYVYTGSINGNVVNASGESVDVYLFKSRNARDAAAAAAAAGNRVTGYYDMQRVVSISGDGGTIGSVTIPGGSASMTFSFGVIWETSSPEFGKDYDRTTYYLLAVDGTRTATEPFGEGVRVSSYSGHPASVTIDFAG